jgi:glucose/arabinose dehydrogenase
MPQMLATGLGGLLDVSLHPRFAQNRLIYLTYSKPGRKDLATRRRPYFARSGMADRR